MCVTMVGNSCDMSPCINHAGVFTAQQSGTGTDSGLISEAPLNPEYIAHKNT